MSEKNFSTKKKVVRTLITAGILLALIAAVYLTLKFTGVLDRFKTAEDIKEFILSTGVSGRLIFVLLQFLQVTFIPLPAMVTTVAGTLIFGPWETMFLSIFAIMAGRLFAFFLGRKLGTKVARWMVGEEDTKKWSDIIGKCKYTFFLMLLFPLFPDDVLCIVAGLTTEITWKYFIFANLICVTVACVGMCFFASGMIIPFSGWGIPVWIALVIIAIVLFIFSIKYRDKIEVFVFKLSEKIKKKKDDKQEKEN